MTYFDAIRFKQDVGLNTTEYDSQINGVWGPRADRRIDSKLTGYTTVPLTTIPDEIREIANVFVRYCYHDHLHQYESAKVDLEEFNSSMADYILGLKQSTNLIIKSQSYRTFPLNANATPFRSISGGNNATDDSDL